MIVKMKRLSLLGLQSEKEAVLATLSCTGCVDVTDQSAQLAQEDWGAVCEKDMPEKSLYELESRQSELTQALAALRPYDYRTKPFLGIKPMTSVKKLLEAYEGRDEALNEAQKVLELQEELGRVYAEETRLKALEAALLPWQTMDLPFGDMRTRHTSAALGTMPAAVQTDQMMEELWKEIPQVHLETVSQDKQIKHVLVIYYRDLEGEILKFLKGYGFTQVTFRELKGSAAQELEAVWERMAEQSAKKDELIGQLKIRAAQTDLLERCSDGYQVKIDRERVKSKLLCTKSAFFLTGYVPERAQAVFEKEMESYCCAYQFEEPAEDDEDVPVLLQNNGVVQPYELITELYSLPTYRGIDPNAVMAPFFCLFFGMMLSDAAYGFLIAAATAFVVWRFKPRGSMGKAMRLAFQCGVSTFIIGILFGSFFGDLIGTVSKMFGGTVEFKGLINPLEQPMTILILSLILGVIHLFTGMGVKAYMCIREKDYAGAFFDNGLWITLLTGCGLLALPQTRTAGIYMALISVAGLILTQGRREKNLFLKLFKGIGSLYGIVSYLSDILSYSRLLALGLATGVISSVINAMASMAGPSFVGIVILAVVVLVGHTLNLAINALGAYVHSSRLQYVEFFGKFYESGGRPFTPFVVHPKYADIDYEEEK